MKAAQSVGNFFQPQQQGISPQARSFVSNLPPAPMNSINEAPKTTSYGTPSSNTIQTATPQPLAAQTFTTPSGLQVNQQGQTTGGQSSLGAGGSNDAFGALSGIFNNPQSQSQMQNQISTLNRLMALQGALAEAGVPAPAELNLQQGINELTNTINNTNPNQLLKDNPAYKAGGITQGQLERETAQQTLPMTQSLANLVLSKSSLTTQRQNQFNALQAEQTGLTNTASLQSQLRQLTMFGGLPPDLVNTILQRQLFPQYGVTTDIYGQPIAYNQYNPSQNFGIGPSLMGGGSGTGGQNAGLGVGNLGQQNNNPGNLKDPRTGQFLQFGSPDQGFNALKQDLLGKMTGATSTPLKATSSLLDFARVYAPASDNNDPTGYAQKLASQLGVSVNTPIGQLRDRIDQFAKAVATNEGFYAGNQQGQIDVATLKSQLPPTVASAVNSVRGIPYFDMGKLTDKEKSAAQFLSTQYGIPLASTNDVEKIQDAETTFLSADNLLKTIEDMSKKIITSQSPLDTAYQQGRGLIAQVPILGSSFQPDTKVFLDTVNAFSSLLTRAAGEKGTLTNQDVARIISALPTLNDTASTAAQKVSNLRSIYESATQAAIQSRLGVSVPSSQSAQPQTPTAFQLPNGTVVYQQADGTYK